MVGSRFGLRTALLAAAGASVLAVGAASAQPLPPTREGSPEDFLRTHLARAHFVWRGATWTDARFDGDPIAVRLPDDHPLDTNDDAGPTRIEPDLSVSNVTISLPWRGVRLDVARAALSGEYLLLEGLTLANEAGTLGVGAMVLSPEALRSFGAAIDGIEDGAPPSPGDAVLDGLAIEMRREAPNGTGRIFASRFQAESLTLVGLTARPDDDAGDADEMGPPTNLNTPAYLDLAGLDAVGVGGSAQFAGRAQFSIGTLAFRGSPRDLVQTVQSVIGLSDAPETSSGFSASMEDLVFNARRGDAPAAGVVVDEGAVEANFGSSASRFALTLTGARATASLFRGSPAEPVVEAIVARSGPVAAPSGLDEGPYVALDVEADATLRRERARVRLTCFSFPGVADAMASVDLTLPEGADPLDLSAATLLGARSEGVRLAVVDHGLGTMVREATGRSVSELLGDAAVSVLESRLPAPIARMTAPPLRSAVETFDREGSLSLAAPSPGPLALALGALLASAGPVEPGTIEPCVD